MPPVTEPSVTETTTETSDLAETTPVTKADENTTEVVTVTETTEAITDTTAETTEAETTMTTTEEIPTTTEEYTFTYMEGLHLHLTKALSTTHVYAYITACLRITRSQSTVISPFTFAGRDCNTTACRRLAARMLDMMDNGDISPCTVGSVLVPSECCCGAIL